MLSLGSSSKIFAWPKLLQQQKNAKVENRKYVNVYFTFVTVLSPMAWFHRGLSNWDRIPILTNFQVSDLKILYWGLQKRFLWELCLGWWTWLDTFWKKKQIYKEVRWWDSSWQCYLETPEVVIILISSQETSCDTSSKSSIENTSIPAISQIMLDDSPLSKTTRWRRSSSVINSIFIALNHIY